MGQRYVGPGGGTGRHGCRGARCQRRGLRLDGPAKAFGAGTQSRYLSGLAPRLPGEAAGSSNPPVGAVDVIANEMLPATFLSAAVTSRPAVVHVAGPVVVGLPAKGFQIAR